MPGLLSRPDVHVFPTCPPEARGLVVRHPTRGAVAAAEREREKDRPQRSPRALRGLLTDRGGFLPGLPVAAAVRQDRDRTRRSRRTFRNRPIFQRWAYARAWGLGSKHHGGRRRRAGRLTGRAATAVTEFVIPGALLHRRD